MDASQLICPQCKAIAIPGSRFCATCGTPLNVGPLTISVGRQIWIYLVSLAVPPLGLIWTFKYLRQKDPQPRRVALIAAVLTVVSTIVTLWATLGIMQSVQSQIQTQMNALHSAGL